MNRFERDCGDFSNINGEVKASAVLDGGKTTITRSHKGPVIRTEEGKPSKKRIKYAYSLFRLTKELLPVYNPLRQRNKPQG